MSKLRCPCGSIISDGSDDLPNKAYVVRDQHYESSCGGLAKDISRFVAAIREGKRQERLSNYFGGESFAGMDDESAIWDIQTRYAVRFETTVYQCDSCGRLLVQTAPDESQFRSFIPEGENCRRILAARGHGASHDSP